MSSFGCKESMWWVPLRKKGSIILWEDQRLVVFLVGLLGVLEIRLCERDVPRKDCGYEICGET